MKKVVIQRFKKAGIQEHDFNNTHDTEYRRMKERDKLEKVDHEMTVPSVEENEKGNTEREDYNTFCEMESASGEQKGIEETNIEKDDEITNENGRKEKNTKKGTYTKGNDCDDAPVFPLNPLYKRRFFPAPVTCFKHAPYFSCFEDVVVGAKVEVLNTDCDINGAYYGLYWIATVMELAGYTALLRYEGFGRNSSKDFWLNLACEEVYPMGWSVSYSQPLLPPKSLKYKCFDMKIFLVRTLLGANTVPNDFHIKMNEEEPSRYSCGMKLEVVDRSRVSKVSLYEIKKITGRRLRLKPCDASSDADVIWVHEDSPLLHEVGWAQKVGYKSTNSLLYTSEAKISPSSEDVPGSCFVDSQTLANNLPSVFEFKSGMKLEAVDLANRSCISPATVMKIAANGYLLLSLDCYGITPDISSWVCYHYQSPYLLPIGFCKKNGIDITPPLDYDNRFVWETYLKETCSIAVPPTLFKEDVPVHGFQIGMQLEIDTGCNNSVCIATISRIVARLLKLHCDGWPERSDQWIDCRSTDLYPIGWNELMMMKMKRPDRQGAKRRKRRRRLLLHTREQSFSIPSNCITLNSIMVSSALSNQTVTGDPESSNIAQSANELSGQCVSHASRRESNCEAKDLNQSLLLFNAQPNPQFTLFPLDVNNTSPLRSLNYDLVGSYFKDQPGSSSCRLQRRSEMLAEKSSNQAQNATVGFKFIPKLDDDADTSEQQDINPEEWNVFDVAYFLKLNNFEEYSNIFCFKNVDGITLLSLTKEDVCQIIGSRLPHSVKIYELIQILKRKMNPQTKKE